MTGSQMTTQDRMEALQRVFVSYCRQVELSSDGLRQLLKFHFGENWALMEVVARGEQQVTFEASNAVGRRYFIAMLQGDYFLLPKPIDPGRFYALDMFEKALSAAGGEVTPENITNITPAVLDKMSETRWRPRYSEKGRISNVPDPEAVIQPHSGISELFAVVQASALETANLSRVLQGTQKAIEANTNEIACYLASQERSINRLVQQLEENSALQRESLPALRKVNESNTQAWLLQTNMLSQIKGLLETTIGKYNPASPGNAVEVAQPAKTPTAETNPGAKPPGPSPAGPSSPRPPTPAATSLERSEYIGLVFTLFCHRNPGTYDPNVLRECLTKVLPELELAAVYRERGAVGSKYTDKASGNPAKYWRLSLPDRHFLLPCPAREHLFYGTEGFAGTCVSPQNIEFCEPALIRNEAGNWYLEEAGRLSAERVEGKPDRRDYEYLLDSSGGMTDARPQNSGGKNPLPPPLLATDVERIVLESDLDKIEKVYLEFCRMDDFAVKDLFSVILEKWKEVVRPKEINVHKIFRYPSGFETTQNYIQNEDFWLILLDGPSSQQGFLFPVIVKGAFRLLHAEVFEVPQDAFGCFPQRLVHLEPATLIRSEKTWRLKKKGSVKWK